VNFGDESVNLSSLLKKRMKCRHKFLRKNKVSMYNVFA
jgi:hypothetical protein